MSSKRQPGRRQTRRQPVTARRPPRRAERPATDVARLKHWYDSHAPEQALPSEKKIIVIPWETMPTPFAVESWDWFLPLATADTKQIDAFYQNHVDQSPESNQAS